MKRIFSLMLVVFWLLALLTACGKNKTILFSSVDFDKALTLAEYKGITLDTSSNEYGEFYDNVIVSDIKNNSLYIEKTEGTVSEGDIANIDYVGKKGGVAFEGGTAQGYDLEIGSNSFIEGFESGLIGAEIGKTIDLNLTFPEDYDNEELKGADVVFTVTVNSVQTTDGVQPKDIYEDLGYKTLKEYENNVKKRAIDNYFLNLVRSKSEIKEYPDEDVKTLKTQIKDALNNNFTSYYNMSLESYIIQNGMTMIDFENNLLNSQIKPLIKETMPLYAILDKEGVTVTEKDIETKLKELVKEYEGSGTSVDAETIKKSVGEYSIENLAVQEKALEIIKENAKIK